MSKAAKDGNSFRREWDKEAFEKKAKERLDAELALEEEREERKTAPQPIVQRAPLQRRTEELRLAKFVNTRQIVTGAQAIAGQMAGASELMESLRGKAYGIAAAAAKAFEFREIRRNVAKFTEMR